MKMTNSPQYKLTGPIPAPPAKSTQREAGMRTTLSTLLLGDWRSTRGKCVCTDGPVRDSQSICTEWDPGLNDNASSGFFHANGHALAVDGERSDPRALRQQDAMSAAARTAIFETQRRAGNALANVVIERHAVDGQGVARRRKRPRDLEGERLAWTRKVFECPVTRLRVLRHYGGNTCKFHVPSGIHRFCPSAQLQGFSRGAVPVQRIGMR